MLLEFAVRGLGGSRVGGLWDVYTLKIQLSQVPLIFQIPIIQEPHVPLNPGRLPHVHPRIQYMCY